MRVIARRAITEAIQGQRTEFWGTGLLRRKTERLATTKVKHQADLYYIARSVSLRYM
jgi:hypothetical protein